MKLNFTLAFCCFTLAYTLAQGVDFENYNIEPDSFLNNADTQGPFQNGTFTFPNTYNYDFDAWSGWAITNKTDVSTAGFTNQYSAITGAGKDNSNNYAVTFVSGSSWIYNSAPLSDQITGIYVTNGTYPYLSMLNGDSFAKRFGGETGDDPDFFLLSIIGYENGTALADTLNFYLADYRSDDNSEDYIVDSWEYIDLQQFRTVDSLEFKLSSSDIGQFGMNTPAYFCMDNLEFEFVLSDHEIEQAPTLSVFPNPTSDFLQLTESTEISHYQIVDFYGRMIQQDWYKPHINVSALPTGSYFLLLMDGQEKIAGKARFVKS